MFKPLYISNCFHPIEVSSSGVVHHVNCGQCPACLRLNASRRVDSITGYFSDHPNHYHYFITLTYDNRHLPLAQLDMVNNKISPVKNQDFGIRNGRSYDFYMTSDKMAAVRAKTFSDTPFHSYKPKATRLFNHVRLNTGKVPVLNRKHVQLFMKQLRYNLYYDYDEYYKLFEIKFVAVGEYGPVHFRPHYHLEIFSKVDIDNWLRKNISQIWKNGFCNIQRSNIQSAKYVAKYISSNGSLPYYLRVSGFRPFCQHSEKFYKQLPENESPFSDRSKDFFKHGYEYNNNGKVAFCLPARAYLTRIFPKCFRFDLSDYSKTLASLCLYRSLFQRGYNKISDFVGRYFDSRGAYVGPYLDISWENPLLLHDSDRFTRQCYQSKMFLKMCQHFNVTPEYYVHRIHEFYSEVANEQLVKFYTDQETFLKEYFYTHDEYDVRMLYAKFYDNVTMHKSVSYSLEPNKLWELCWFRYKLFGFYHNELHAKKHHLQQHYVFRYGMSQTLFLESLGFSPHEFATYDVFDVDSVCYRNNVVRMLEEDVKHKKFNDENRYIIEYGVT